MYESAVPAPDTSTTCPSWCVSTADEHAEGTHYGPTFGQVSIQLGEKGEPVAFVPHRPDAHDVVDLCELAAEITAAAAWLAGHR
ncbi:hypothetical protein JCM18899A_32700 [Nocardioides sp. AN3]